MIFYVDFLARPRPVVCDRIQVAQITLQGLTIRQFQLKVASNLL